MITLHAFGNGPDDFMGFTRDLRIQWALEEMRIPYRVEALDYNAGAVNSENFRKISWSMVVLNTLEMTLASLDMAFVQKESDPKGAAANIEERVSQADYLVDDRFSVADILLSNAWRRTMNTPVLKDFDALRLYRKRCEERPAWKKALKDYEARFKVPEGMADPMDCLQ